MAWIGVASALEQIESLAETVEDLRGREHTRAGGSELDRERQIVESAAELGDRLVRIETRALAKQFDRLRLGERWHRVVDLARDPQQLPAGDQEPQVRARLEQLRKLRSRLHHLLEVVEQQQQLPVCDVLREPAPCPEHLRDRLCHQRGIAERGQADPEHARLERRHELGGNLEREPRLTRPSRPGQCDQARAVPKQTKHLVPLARPTDERRSGTRQVRIRDRLQRRKTPRAELEQSNRLVEILQAVLPQLRQLALDKLARRRRHKHLAAMAASSYPGSPMQLEPGIALPG